MASDSPDRPNAQFYKDMFKNNGRPSTASPMWAKARANLMESAFVPYESTTQDTFPDEVALALRRLGDMKHPKYDCPVYLGVTPEMPDYSEVTKAVVPDAPTPLVSVIEDMVELLDGLPNSSHPLHQPNVLPNPNKAAIIANMLANYTSQNAIEGEYAWNLSKAEMETAAMITDFITPGWSKDTAGGMFTYGGSGCYLYGLKYALAHVVGSSRCEGVRVEGKVFCSQQGHYAKMNATDWLGIGMNNYVDIDCMDDTNTMDLEDLEQEFQAARDADPPVPVLAVMCTMGTTDAFAIDPVKGVRELVSKYPNPPGYNETIIYCDAVIGWSFLPFRDYDFVENPLQFCSAVVKKIEETYVQISDIQFADAVGIDFHKTGWAPYTTSMFLVRDLDNYKKLMSRPGSAYLQARTPYNPGLYTLEVSRSAAPALAAWSTLKYFGKQGIQSIVGGVLEISQCLRALIAEEESMVCVNDTDYGFVTLFRVYKEGVNANEQYEKERTVDSKEAKLQLYRNNQYQKKIADQMWAWFRNGEKIEGLYGPYTTYTSGFRTTDYNDNMGDQYGVIYALKSYPMNISVNPTTMENMIKAFKIARAKVDSDPFPDPPSKPIAQPYGDVEPPSCGPDDANSLKITSMLSGVPGVVKRKGKRGVANSDRKDSGSKKEGCSCKCECD